MTEKLVTVSNDRIKVTVTREVWDSYQKDAESQTNRQNLPADKTLEQAIFSTQRGLVLSTAMSKLANLSEAALLELESIDSREVLNMARDDLIIEWLTENSRYDLNKLITRWRNGNNLSDGMALEITKAEAYADSIVNPVDGQEQEKLAVELFHKAGDGAGSNGELELRFKREQAVYKLRTGVHGSSEECFAKVRGKLEEWHRADIEVRLARGNMDGWEIEVIGDLPEYVGVCRLASNK